MPYTAAAGVRQFSVKNGDMHAFASSLPCVALFVTAFMLFRRHFDDRYDISVSDAAHLSVPEDTQSVDGLPRGSGNGNRW